MNLPLPNELAFLSAFAIAGGLYFFVRGFRLLSRKRLLINTPTSKIRSASIGLVEVSGVASGPHVLRSPIAGVPCFLYHTTAWQKSDESRTGEWKKVAEETLHVPFFVDDSTGRLLIHPEGAELDLHRDFCQSYSDTFFSPRAGNETLSFLARHGVTPDDKIRIEECTIRPESSLFIVGTLAENPGRSSMPEGTDGSPRVAVRYPPATPPPMIIQLSERETTHSATATQQSRIAAALNKAGITSPAAWQAAGVPYRDAEIAAPPRVNEIAVNGATSPSAQNEQPALNPAPPVVLMKGENNSSFLISWRSQHELVKSLAWKSAAMIWLGAGLALLGTYMLIAQFGL